MSWFGDNTLEQDILDLLDCSEKSVKEKIKALSKNIEYLADYEVEPHDHQTES